MTPLQEEARERAEGSLHTLTYRQPHARNAPKASSMFCSCGLRNAVKSSYFLIFYQSWFSKCIFPTYSLSAHFYASLLTLFYPNLIYIQKCSDLKTSRTQFLRKNISTTFLSCRNFSFLPNQSTLSVSL